MNRIDEKANERLEDFDAVGAVRFDRQELSQTQKEQAKGNIDAGGAIVCESSGETVTIADASDQPLRGLKLYGKSVQNGTPTPENPVEIENAVVNRISSVGANLIPFPYVSRNLTSNGVTFTMQDDGGVYISGTTTAQTYYILAENVDYGEENAFWTIGLTRQLGDYWITNVSYNASTKALLMILPPSTKFDATYYPMMNYGETALPYEPYKGGTATLAQPVTLPGLPVSSGGNYTDANGQQWLCDEMDFARGVYVQRVGKVDLGTLEWTLGYEIYFSTVYPDKTIGLRNFITESGIIAPSYNGSFDDSFPSGTWGGDANYPVINYKANAGQYASGAEFKAAMSGVMMYCELATPVETPISETDLTAYRTLHTNKPNTTVYTDSNAGLTVAYAADTKTYIDNKFAELAAAVLQNA